jgi:hypothetical protein
LPELLQCGLALFAAWLFAVAGWHKWRAPAEYIALMRGYVPRLPASAGLVRALAVAELLLAGLMLLPALRATGLRAGAALLVLYALLMAMQWLGGRRDARCGCAGPDSSLRVSPGLVLRNLVCALVLASASLPGGAYAPGIGGFATTLFIAVFCILLYLCAEQLIANAQRLGEAR